MKDEDYFLKEKKQPKVTISEERVSDDEASPPAHKHVSRRFSVTSMKPQDPVEDQLKFIDNMGTDLEGFIQQADHKRDKEMNALEDAE